MFRKSLLTVSLLVGTCFLLPGLAHAQSEQAINSVRRTEIQTNDGETVGRIREMSVNLNNGRILEVFVLSNDFLGFGGHLVPVPPSALTHQVGEDVYRVDMSREEFRRAPKIKRSIEGNYQNRARVLASHRYFSKRTEFDESNFAQNSNDNETAVSSSQLIRSSKLMDMPIVNRANEQIGQVRGVSYLIAPGIVKEIRMAEAASSGTTSVLQVAALRLNATRTALLLNDSLNAVDAAPNSELIEAQNGQEAYYRSSPSNDQAEATEAAAEAAQ